MPAIFAGLDQLVVQRVGRAGLREKHIGWIESIINSMASAERPRPEPVKASRMRPIAAGAGVSMQGARQHLSQFEQMKKRMKVVAESGMQKMMRSMKRGPAPALTGAPPGGPCPRPRTRSRAASCRAAC
jgi:signal recognition particle GTPase